MCDNEIKANAIDGINVHDMDGIVTEFISSNQNKLHRQIDNISNLREKVLVAS